MKQQKPPTLSSAVIGSPTLSKAGMPIRGAPTARRQSPASGVAARLVAHIRDAEPEGLIFIARSEHHAEEVSRALAAFLPAAQVILLPPWDCLPYDRVQPSRDCMGRRVSALVAMGEQATVSSLIVVMSAEAALARILPVATLATSFTFLSAGEPLDLEALRDRLLGCGYLMDDRVDEPGEFALLGQCVDVFSPGAEQPCRIFIEQGAIANIRFYDPVSQRTNDDVVETVTLAPSTELLASGIDPAAHATQSIEVSMLMANITLTSVFELLPNCPIIVGPGTDQRFEAAIDLINEAREAREQPAAGQRGTERFYLDRAGLDSHVKRRHRHFDLDGVEALPDFIAEVSPVKAAALFVGQKASTGSRVVLAGEGVERARKAISRYLEQDIVAAESWSQIFEAAPGSVMSFNADIAEGFTDNAASLSVITAGDIFGIRLNMPVAEIKNLSPDAELRLGDVVLHEDHGIAVLRALETIDVNGIVADAVRLEYQGGANLLAPVDEFGRIWRYGAEEEAVTLDKLSGGSWAIRRERLESEIDDVAEHLVRLAAERQKAGARVLKPPRATYARFAARFPYPETGDQTAAIAAVIADLSSGWAMNRLICGDVGYGKTEVALRASAVAALNCAQVAVVAPTTVLARQHFETFSRRFEGTGVAVALLSRLVTDAEAKRIKEALADGSVRIVVGTHAIAAEDVAFAELALLVLDEEHRFGVKLKQQLRGLAPRLHVLSMSATPIPRTLAGAMAGVQETSLLRTPPARRRPVRTEVAPFDAASVKTALIREYRRGGQSFYVVPRVEDIEPMAAQLNKLVPDLSVLIAHGALKPADMDEAMIRFANGDGDILLSTNIIESGLDVPRANTVIVHRSDRFGLAQLHQLRGRVGRGRVQARAFLLTAQGKEMPDETRSRLSTLIAFDRLGSGLAISARDLDLRGAGDLIGEEQAGHLKLVGLGLYQHLLARAVDRARGNERTELNPAIDLELSGSLPADYVPEAVVRLNLYARLQRFETVAEVEAFADELDDRFGQPPGQTDLLLSLARLKLTAASVGIVKIGAGPSAIAIELADPNDPRLAGAKLRSHCKLSNGRLIFNIGTSPGPQRLKAVQDVIQEFLRKTPIRRRKAKDANARRKAG